MKKFYRSLVLLALAALLTSCISPYRVIVTLTEIDDQAMTAWVKASVAGQTTPALDAKVKTAQDKFKKAATITADALEAYRLSGDKTQYQAAFSAARAAMKEIIDLILPVVPPAKGDALSAQLKKAYAL